MKSLGALGAAQRASSRLTFRRLRALCPRGVASETSAENEDDGQMQSPAIHPSAVIHPRAVIGQGVSIGAFCSIGPSVKIGDNCQLRPGCHIFGDTELGESCILLPGAIVGSDHPGSTIIGRKNTIGFHAVVGAKCQDLKYIAGDECFLHVGDSNDIREYASIHRSSHSKDETVIGNNNLVMGACHIAHDCKIGNNNIFSNNSLFAGHVEVEDYVRTSGASIVHQFCHLGSHCFISGGSAVSQDVPRYMMVSGNRAEIRGLNLEGLRRHGFSSSEIRALKRAYRNIFMPKKEQCGCSVEERISLVEEDEELSASSAVLSMVNSIRDSFGTNRRGICHVRNYLSPV